jgi:hypothetical protein
VLARVSDVHRLVELLDEHHQAHPPSGHDTRGWCKPATADTRRTAGTKYGSTVTWGLVFPPGHGRLSYRTVLPQPRPSLTPPPKGGGCLVPPSGDCCHPSMSWAGLLRSQVGVSSLRS